MVRVTEPLNIPERGTRQSGREETGGPESSPEKAVLRTGQRGGFMPLMQLPSGTAAGRKMNPGRLPLGKGVFQMAKTKEKKNYTLNLPHRIGYGVGDFGINLFSTVVGSFLTAYYTDSVLLGTLFVGNMMLFTRVLDGVSDLVMGAIIDNTYTKWGKARPWMAIAVIPFCLSFFLVFNVPAALGTTATQIYVVVTYIFHTVICSTIANVALSTLAVKITNDSATRSSAVSIRIMFSNIAIFIGNSYTASIVAYFGGNQQGYFGMALLYSIIAAICLAICAFSNKEVLIETREQEKARMLASGVKQQDSGIGAILTALFSNHYVLPMAIAFAFNWLAISINGGAQVYYCRDVLGSMSYMSTLSMARSLSAIVVLLVGFAPIYIGKLGKKTGIILGCAMQILSCIIMWAAPTNVMALVVGNILKGVFQGLVNTVLFATVTDISDYVDLKNNVSIAGMTNSITSFGMKVGVGLGSAVLGYVLAWGNYNAANIATGMPAETLFAEQIAYILVPGICLVVVLIVGFLIDVDKKLPELRAQQAQKEISEK